MLTDGQIKQAIADGHLSLEPFAEDSLEPASYDLRLGKWAFASSSKQKYDVSSKGVLVIEAGEFAVVETLERVRFDRRIAAQLGLRSEFARRGLLMLSGPQVDPGFEGILVVRVVNLAPNSLALAYGTSFLTAQFFKLTEDVANPYQGPRQAQGGISSGDIQELAQTEGLTLGEMVKTMVQLGQDVSELKGAVGRLSWSIPIIVGLGMAVIGVIVALK
jgi:dCTP deaminase